MYKRICGILLIIVSCACGIPMPAGALETESQIVFISEIRISGQAEPKEYIELMNVGDDIVDLSSYRLEYAKPAFGSAYCNEPDWKNAATDHGLDKVINAFTLSGITIQPRGKVYVGLSMNNDIPGAVRLRRMAEDVSIVHELVGWGDEDNAPPCSKGTPAAMPTKGAVLKRLLDEDGMPISAESNAEEFVLSQYPTPTVDDCPANNPCDHNTEPDDPETPLPTEYLTIEITEVLPDPIDLPDDQAEFIEVFNPNPTAVSLEGYALQTGSQTSKKYILPNYVLNTQEYLAVYSSESGLILSNSGSSARVYSPGSEIINEMPPYESIKPGVTWAKLGDKWEFTTLPTPKSENKPTPLISAPVEVGETVFVNEEALKPCQEGWYRNPETNRCKKIEATTVVAYTPCAEGYERNPETNRCRKIVTESTLQPCGPGEERNPETNRCRKIVQPLAAVAGIDTVSSDQNQGKPRSLSMNWIIGSALAGVVVSYGAYEWRHEIMTGIRHLRDKLTASR